MFGQLCQNAKCFSFQLVTDYEFGVGIDTVAKQNQQQENTYFYSFEYKSWNDYLPHWMGEKIF